MVSTLQNLIIAQNLLYCQQPINFLFNWSFFVFFLHRIKTFQQNIRHVPPIHHWVLYLHQEFSSWIGRLWEFFAFEILFLVGTGRKNIENPDNVFKKANIVSQEIFEEQLINFSYMSKAFNIY